MNKEVFKISITCGNCNWTWWEYRAKRGERVEIVSGRNKFYIKVCRRKIGIRNLRSRLFPYTCAKRPIFCKHCGIYPIEICSRREGIGVSE